MAGGSHSHPLMRCLGSNDNASPSTTCSPSSHIHKSSTTDRNNNNKSNKSPSKRATKPPMTYMTSLQQPAALTTPAEANNASTNLSNLNTTTTSSKDATPLRLGVKTEDIDKSQLKSPSITHRIVHEFDLSSGISNYSQKSPPTEKGLTPTSMCLFCFIFVLFYK